MPGTKIYRTIQRFSYEFMTKAIFLELTRRSLSYLKKKYRFVHRLIYSNMKLHIITRLMRSILNRFDKRSSEYMILYVVEHMAYLSKMLALRLKLHRNEKAMLVCYKLKQDHPKLFQNIQKSKLFDVVHSFHHIGRKCDTDLDIKNELVEGHSKITKQLMKCKKAYVGFDNCPSFSVITLFYDIETWVVEPFPNWIQQWSSQKNFEAMVRRQICSEAWSLLCQRMMPYTGQGKAVVSPETEVPVSSDFIKYDFDANFGSLIESEKQKILSWYEVDFALLAGTEISLLLPISSQFFAGCAFDQLRAVNKRVFEISPLRKVLRSQIFGNLDNLYNSFYVNLCDYFCQFPLVVKNHPHTDFELNYLENNAAYIIPSNFPAEFLRLVPNLQVRHVLSIGAKVSGQFTSMSSNVMNFSLDSIADFFKLEKLYTAVKFLISIRRFNEQIELYGISEEVFRELFFRLDNDAFLSVCSFDDLDMLYQSTGKIKVIDTSSTSLLNLGYNTTVPYLNDFPKDVVCIYLNSYFDYCFVDKQNHDNLQNIYPMVIRKESPPYECGIYVETVLYVFTKDLKTGLTAKQFSFAKDLPFSGQRLTVKPVSQKRFKKEVSRGIELRRQLG